MLNHRLLFPCCVLICGTIAAQDKASFSSFLDLPYGFVIGGSWKGHWLESEDAGKRLNAPATDYRVYTLAGKVRTITASKAAANEELCPDVWVQKVSPEPDFEEKTIGVHATWDPMPRAALAIDVKQEKYEAAVRDLLIGRGLAKPKVKIRQLLRIDLEGDGKEEVLIAATHYKNEAELISAKAGDYSFVALRRVVDGKVLTQFVMGEVYPKSDTNGLLNAFEVGGLLDLDGDGVLEVVIRSSYYEGGGAHIWQLEGEKLVNVLSVVCGA